jgi:predicted Rossmann fold flavoprotein
MQADRPMSAPTPFDLAIVGAGAAGLATAIFAARERPGRPIVLLDGARTLGAKILVSGGGRCNVTNRLVTEADFNGGSPRTVRRVLRALSVDDTIAFFRGLGVTLHEEPLGKMFPETDRARTVLDALLAACRAAGVELRHPARVTHLAHGAPGFVLETSGGRLHAEAVVLATGGLSLPKSGSDGAGYALARACGHSLVPTTPALVPLVLDGDFHAGLSGVSQPATLSLEGAPGRSAGALLWTHFGVSGPAALDLSRHWLRARLGGPAPPMRAALLPGMSFDEAERGLLATARLRPRLHVGNALAERMPAAVAAALLARSSVPGATPLGTLSRAARRAILHAATALRLEVRDSRGYTHAEVTAGGIPLEEIDPATMQSRKQPGLFLVGEMLDVDGRLGGFNFQWAWASARAASMGVARFLATRAMGGVS